MQSLLMKLSTWNELIQRQVCTKAREKTPGVEDSVDNVAQCRVLHPVLSEVDCKD